ncbi:MAG: FecR domain-containing protein [Cytophagales bacterium]|nr:FecR domain-containing protein [Cytophagales bacterium]
MAEKDINELIAKSLAGELNPQEHSQLEEWINTDPKNEDVFNEFHQLRGRGSIYVRSNTTLNNAFDDPSLNPKEQFHSPKNRMRTISIFWKVAAVVAFVAISVFVLRHSASKSEQGRSSSLTSASRSISTQSGQKKQVILPDNTMVWLNSSSQITYSETINTGSSRRIQLKGEAYFNVKRDPGRPFIVSTEHLSITALGTAFNVNAYHLNDKGKVVLEEGKVLVELIDTEKNLNRLTLLPGESALAEINSKGVQKFREDEIIDFKWKEGILSFKRATVKEVVETLERWYGVSIDLTGPFVNDWKYTAEFDNENLENVLHAMSYSQDFTFTIKKKKVFITF